MKNPHISYFLLFVLFISASFNNVLCFSVPEQKPDAEMLALAASVRVNIDAHLDSVPYFDPNNAIIGKNEWEELEIGHIVTNWKKYAKTQFDLWGVKKLLQYAPVGSREIIQCFVKDEKSFKMFDSMQEAVRESQHALISYFGENDKLRYDAESLYFSFLKKWVPSVSTTLNNSAMALETSQLLEFMKPCTSLLAALGLSGALNGFIFSKLFKTPFNLKESVLRGFTEPIRNNNVWPAVYKKESDFDFRDTQRMYKFISDGTVGDRYIVGKSLLNTGAQGVIKNKKVTNVISGGLSAALQAFAVGAYDYRLVSRIKGSVERLAFLHKTAKRLQKQLADVAMIMRTFKGIDELVKHSEAFVDCKAIVEIRSFLNKNNVSKKMKKLLGYLETATFDKTNSAVFSRGRMLIAHKLLMEVKGEFVPFLQNVGILGGYMTIARMFKDHQDDSPVKFCFVDFVDQDAPYVKLKNAWPPLINREDVVGNDIALGVDGGATNAVFTGPNGGGKTTSMLMVALNVLFSRLGIAAAEQAQMSHFKKIRTSLRPKADIKAGMSTFMSEQSRVKEVIDSINACVGNILVLMDEPYSGTVEAESAYRVYKFGKDFVERPHAMLLIATHLEQPINLAKDTAAFANFQMGYLEHVNKTFTRTFKLERGPALWWFHNDRKRATFVDWLCENEIG